MALVFLPQHAFAQSACKDQLPEVSIKTATTRTKYIRSKSSKDLTNLHGNGGQVGGLGGGEIGFKTQGRFQITGSGRSACVKLKELEVIFYAKPEIHVASNFGRATCEYNAVMKHEKGHIRILRKFVREYSPKVKAQLMRVSRKLDTAIGPISPSQVEKAQNKILQDFMKQVEAYHKKIMPILAKRQQAHDSPKEYARVANKCRKWDEKFADN